MSRHSHDQNAVAAAEVQDPVCGMTIAPADAVGHIDHNGHTYYFCSEGCMDQFRATPDAFLHQRPAAPSTPAEMEREYTCPMDPEVRQKGPGDTRMRPKKTINFSLMPRQDSRAGFR